MRHIRTDKFRYTLGAFLASVLTALHTLVPIIFAFSCLQQFLREHGVAQEHFHWRDWLTSDVERATDRLVIILLPAYFVALMFENQGNAAFQYGLDRLAYVVAMFAVLNFAYRVAHPDGFVLRHVVLRYPNSLVVRLLLPIRITAIVLPLSFILLATAGYYYTALNLGQYLMQTAALIIIAITLCCLAMRWLLLAESRLALKRAKERNEAERKAADEHIEAQETGEDDLPIDIATINAQTRMILSNVIGWSFAVGLYFIWQGALPAFGAFESISLWEIAVAGANGTEYQQFALATVLAAAVVFIVTFVAAKNLPGVLEIGLPQRPPLQPGSRYAITTLAHYIIWTLSDPVNRVRVNIGIAYGSDVRTALKIMTEVLQSEKMVLDDPAPRALSAGFGDSSLDFEIQFYIRDMADRLPAVHELYIAINERFAEASIEILFPHRDLHVRSVNEEIKHGAGSFLESDAKPQA